MLRRYLVTVSLAAGLLTAAGCSMCVDFPTFPRLRSLLPGNDPCCPPNTAFDVEGPLLEPGGPVLTSGGPPPAPEGTMPPPRIVPQASTSPGAQPMPYVPPKD